MMHSINYLPYGSYSGGTKWGEKIESKKIATHRQESNSKKAKNSTNERAHQNVSLNFTTYLQH